MENIYTSAKPFVTFANYSGLFPLSFEGSAAKGILNLRKINLVFVCASLFTLICFIAINVVNKSFVVNNSALLVEAWNICVIAELLSFLYLFVYQNCKRDSVVKFLKEIHEVDEDVKYETQS